MGKAMSLPPTLERLMPLADRLFSEIREKTWDGIGISRAPYGPGEQVAADVLAATARQLDLEVKTDWAGNLYMSYTGSDPVAPPFIVGSHMDSVPRGGNFDGLAGIVAGLVSVAALRRQKIQPRRGIMIMGIRAEENAWFGAQHVGSRLALGRFDPDLLDSVRRIDTGLTLAEHIVAAGFDVDPLRKRQPYLSVSQVESFIELHIEQGPLLESRGIPVGIVTAIRGNVRCGNCMCLGSYDHSGTVPRELRKDAVLATAELVVEMDRIWASWLEKGEDLVLTFGRLYTDRNAHSITTIPGEVRFSFDARSHSTEVLTAIRSQLLHRAEEIGRRRLVKFQFERFVQDDPAPMTEGLVKQLEHGANELGIPFLKMPSGAGHDAADFVLAGIPSAMIFVRNSNGSHNPAEAMRIEDFMRGVQLLLWLITSAR